MNRARQLAPALTAIIREHGPAHSRAAIEQLRREGRVSRGVTFRQAAQGCWHAVMFGWLEHRPGLRGGVGTFAVPGDSRPEWEGRWSPLLGHVIVPRQDPDASKPGVDTAGGCS